MNIIIQGSFPGQNEEKKMWSLNQIPAFYPESIF